MKLNKTQIIKFNKQLSSNNKQNNSHWNKTGTHLYKLKKPDKYYDIHKPQISPQKLKNIYKKIKLDAQINKIVSQRFKNNNYFINYGYNHFSDLRRKSYDTSRNKSSKNLSRNLSKSPIRSNKHQFIHKETDLPNFTNEDNILEGILKAKNKKMPLLQTQAIQNRLSKVNLSQKWLKQMHHQKQLLKSNKNKVIIFNKEQIKKQIMQLDQIVNMKDGNFFMENQKKIKNIFEVLRLKDMSYFKDKSLIQYKFCFKSPIQKSQKLKINPQRNMSTFTRNLCFQPLKSLKKQRIDLLNSHQLSVNINFLLFKDIINISASIVTPQIADTLIFGERFSEKPLIEIDLEDDSDDSKLNFKTDYKEQNIQKHDIYNYLNLQPRGKQIEYKNKCKVIIDDIKQSILIRKKLYNKSVKDRSVHKNLSDKVNNKLNYLLNLDNKTTQTKQEFYHHQLKNAGIKAKSILQAILYKKKTQQSYRHVLPNTSRN